MLRKAFFVVVLAAFVAPVALQAQDFPGKGTLRDLRITSSQGVSEPVKALFLIKTDAGNVPVSLASIEQIVPEWIEAIDVIKSQAAVQQFGEKGREGVILIKIKPEREQQVLQMVKKG
ncbi:hypothetical protein [Rufibacter quisquiliarum]|uniref:TonB-dependent receptor plug domain-containing protein n=1 Tax=Rufibacter quisquiliarum TaxID=1549639 RepID=A0A839GUH5_9BACT|nr:hypothetical protein [Rufibacter quisquiliarum]MBA9078068.1 hypothetical protein [Rufibacter quisquiliarum]